MVTKTIEARGGRHVLLRRFFEPALKFITATGVRRIVSTSEL